MSSYTNHMQEDDVLYRGVLEYEQVEMECIPNPNYNPNAGYGGAVNTWSQTLIVPSGAPDKTITDYIGPYESPRPIKAYITRKRKQYKNLRLVRIEKTTGWEEVKV